MADADWSPCPECGVPVKSSNLAQHKARVHGRKGAGMPRQLRRALVVTVVALAVVALAWLVLQAGQETPIELQVEEEPYWGDAQAPLTVFLFADYQCPFCARYETEGPLDRFLAKWVETGQVRIVYKDLAFVSADSIVAAEASQVVWAMAPQRWHEWNRHIFENQGQERSGWASRDGIVALTQAWGGVDMMEFTQRLDAREFRAEVEEDNQEARRGGISSTPTMVVGNHRLNALDEPAVDAAVREALG